MSNPYYTPQSGLGSIGSYQISGIPWASSSIAGPPVTDTPTEIVFPTITKFVVVKNVNPSSANLRVGFSENGVKNTNNYFLLGKNESFGADIRVTKLYLLSDGDNAVSASVIVGLTGIDSQNLPNSWSGSVGVG